MISRESMEYVRIVLQLRLTYVATIINQPYFGDTFAITVRLMFRNSQISIVYIEQIVELGISD